MRTLRAPRSPLVSRAGFRRSASALRLSSLSSSRRAVVFADAVIRSCQCKRVDCFILRSEQGVDERSHRRALCEHDQATEQQEHDDDRVKPELLPLFHKCPELKDKFTHFEFLLPSTDFSELAGHMAGGSNRLGNAVRRRARLEAPPHRI